MSSELHVVTRCRKVDAVKVFECQSNSTEAKETQRLRIAVAGIYQSHSVTLTCVYQVYRPSAEGAA